MNSTIFFFQRLTLSLFFCSSGVFVYAQGNDSPAPTRELLADSVYALIEAGRDSAAVELADQVVYDDSGKLIADALTGRLLRKKAMRLRRPLRRVDEALATHGEEIYWAHLLPERTDSLLFDSYHYRGSVAFFENNYDLARVSLRQAIAYGDRTPNVRRVWHLDAFRLLTNIAIDEYDVDLVRSLTRRGTALIDKYFKDTDNRMELLISREMYLDGADARDRVGDYEVARRYAYAGLAIGEKMGDVAGIIRCLNLVAVTERRFGNVEIAYGAYDRAIAMYERDPERAGEISYIYNNFAQALQNEDDHRRAIVMFDEAIRTSKDFRYVEVIPGILADKALSLTYLGDTETAESLYRQAAEIIAYGATTVRGEEIFPVADSVDLPYELLTLLETRLDALLLTGRYDRALLVVDELVNQQEKLRAGLISDGSRRFNSGIQRTTLDDALRICFDLAMERSDRSYLWRAFDYSEQARAYSLLTALQRNRLQLSPEEKELRSRITVLERKISVEPEAYPELDKARIALRNLVAGEAAETVLAGADSVRMVTALARSQATLMTFHLGEEYAYVFQLSPGAGLEVSRLDSTAVVERLTTRWRDLIRESAFRGRSLRAPDVQARLDEAATLAGDSLTRILFPQGTPSGDDLVIVPDGILHFLPFAALPDTSGEGNYLFAGKNLRFEYAASLVNRNIGPDNYTVDFVGMAPSFRGERDVYALNDFRATRGPVDNLPGLRPLANNQEEVAAVADYFGDARQYLGTDATRAAFLAEAGHARILHLSTHGVMDSERPNLSFVAFAQRADSLELDNLLFYNDLANIKLPAELVVLAACETSLGEIAPGETPLSMASAFSAAGARGTLTTLWQVDDAATARFMEAFYAALTGGAGRAEALEAARHRLQKDTEYGHPYYWAGFTLHGASGPIVTAKAGPNYWMYAGIVLAGLGLGLVLGLRRLRQ